MQDVFPKVRAGGGLRGDGNPGTCVQEEGGG